MSTSSRRDERRPSRSLRLRGLVAVVAAMVLVACEAAPQTTSAPIATRSPGASPTASGVAPSATAAPQGASWVEVGSLATPRIAPRLVVLGDGRVLAVGSEVGCVGSFMGAPEDSTTAELWELATASWSATEALDTPRAKGVVAALPDGRALVAGGANAGRWDKHAELLGFQSYSSAWTFDPATARWARAGLMGRARTDASSAALPDGRVLVAGGYFVNYIRAEDYPWLVGAGVAGDAPAAWGDGGMVLAAWPPRGTLADVSPPGAPGSVLATAELFDPQSGTWSRTGPMASPRYAAPAVVLADGRVLVAGQDAPSVNGYEVWSDRDVRAEVYDPARGRFAVTGPYPGRSAEPDASAAPPWSAELVALGDGGALLVGGYVDGLPTATTLRYDPARNAWAETGPLATARANPAAATLADGRVLVAGGEDAFGPTASAEIYDPATGSWSAAPAMPGPRTAGATVLLADGSVLVAGGWAAHSHDWADQLCPPAIAEAVRFVPGP